MYKIFVLFLMCFLLVGCSNTTHNEEPNNDTTIDEPVIYAAEETIDELNDVIFNVNIDKLSIQGNEDLVTVNISLFVQNNLEITLPSTHYEGDAAVIQARFVLLTDHSIRLYTQFDGIFSQPAVDEITLNRGETLTKEIQFNYLYFYTIEGVNDREIMPPGDYILQVAFYQGTTLESNDWIDTSIIINVSTSETLN